MKIGPRKLCLIFQYMQRPLTKSIPEVWFSAELIETVTQTFCTSLPYFLRRLKSATFGLEFQRSRVWRTVVRKLSSMSEN